MAGDNVSQPHAHSLAHPVLTQSAACLRKRRYEQDWLFNELEGVPALTKNVTLGRQWLLQMGEGAAAADLSVQYCEA